MRKEQAANILMRHLDNLGMDYDNIHVSKAVRPARFYLEANAFKDGVEYEVTAVVDNLGLTDVPSIVRKDMIDAWEGL